MNEEEQGIAEYVMKTEKTKAMKDRDEVIERKRIELEKEKNIKRIRKRLNCFYEVAKKKKINNRSLKE